MRSKFLYYAIIITLAQLSGCYLAFGCWLEEYEAVLQYFFAGVYTLPPSELVYIDIYCGIIPFLSKLAFAAYPFPLHEYLLFAIIGVCCFLINYYAFLLLENARAHRVSFIITVVIFSLLIFPQFIVPLQCTRVSVLLCTAAFFAASIFFIQERKDTRHLLIVILLLAAGTVLRIFTAGIATGLFLVLALFMWRTKFLRSRFGWIFIIFFFIQLGLIAGLLHYRTHHNHPGERYVMNYEYAVTNRNDLYPLPLGASRQDSVRYELIRNWFVTDTVALSESLLKSFIRHVTISDILSDRDYLSERFAGAITALAGFTRQYLYALIALLGFISMLPFRQKILGVGWIAIVAALLVMLTIIGSMYDRGFAPFICLVVSGLWLLWVQHQRVYGKNALYLFLMIVFATAFFSIGHLAAIRKENIKWHEAGKQFSQIALQLDSLHPVMMQSADMVMFSNKAFEKFPSRTNGSIIMLNAGYLSFYEFIKQPYRQQYNLDITNGQSVAGFIRAQNEKGVVLFTTNERCALFKDYLRELFGLVIDVNELDVPPVESPQHTLHFFRIRASG